ncbi:MAG: hypothetical protein CMC40_03830 [Flavobacteriaceae bacterium]|nr:hypothetical protein [Flavobacteriaceae bacterium]
MSKINLLFLGTTDYGFELSKSDQNKFKELNTKFNIYVFTFGKRVNEIDFGIVKIKYLKLPKSLLYKYIKFYFLSIFKLNKFINENNITIVSAKEPIAALNPVLLKIIFRKKIKIIIENHGDFRNQLVAQRDSMLISRFIFLTEFIVKFVFKHVDILRGVSEQNSNYFKKYNSELKIYNFPAWVDSSIFSNDNLRSREDLLFVGNIIKRKGVDFLIESCTDFLIENPHIKFKLIGKIEDENYFKKINTHIEKYNLQKNVLFFNKVNQQDVANYMNSSKILLMASSSEGLPRVLIESGLCGLPSVASNIDGIYNPFFTNGGTLVYNLNSKEEIEEKIRTLYQDKNIWLDLSNKSYKLSKSLSGSGTFVKNWDNLIKMMELNE